jgi:FMN-dependent NADH-azoreductase
MSLFRLDASIRTEGSHSRAIADIVEQEWQAHHPEGTVVRRHLGADPIPATAWANAVFTSWTPEGSRSPEQKAAQALAAEAVDQLVEAEALLFAVPLYNFGVSQHFKTWIDLVIAEPRMGAGVEPVVAGKPAVLVVVRGGSYADGTPREGWDHETPYLERILRDVWKLDLKVVDAEFTLVGVNPALDEFAELAAELRVRSEQTAREHGRALAGVGASA